MKSITGKQMCKLLEGAGWRLISQKGSHCKFKKEGSAKHIIVPVHGNEDLKSGA
jgi:predicted RNA binding protein YcfA (HicA-like mRNA interferase family)